MIVKFFKRHPLVFALTYTVFYLTVFYYLEMLIEPRYIIHCALDDILPFCEYFIVPYLLWFIYIPVVCLYLIKKDVDSFWRLALMMFGGMTICILMYILFPNGVLLREKVPDNNIFCRLVNILYLRDTSTNVCPSIHTLNTLAAHTALCRSYRLEKASGIKLLSGIFAASVCLSTVFLDQHSVIDVACAAALCLVLGLVAYRPRENALDMVHN